MPKHYKKTTLIFLLIFVTESFCNAWFNSIKKYYYQSSLIAQQILSSKFFYLATICVGILTFSYKYMKKTAIKHGQTVITENPKTDSKNSIKQKNIIITLYFNSQQYLLKKEPNRKSILKKGLLLKGSVKYLQHPEKSFLTQQIITIKEHFLTLSANEFLTHYNKYFLEDREIPFLELCLINNILVSLKLHDFVMNNDVLKNNRQLFSFTYLYDEYNYKFHNKDFQDNCKTGEVINIKTLYDLQLCALLIVNSSQNFLPGMTSLYRLNLKKIFLDDKNYNLTRSQITNELKERIKQVNQKYYVIRV